MSCDTDISRSLGLQKTGGKEVGVDVELAFREIIVATWRRGLDWT
jgi:hypothetical protein